MHLCLAPMDGITTCATRLLTKEIFEKFWNPDDTLTLRTEFMNVDGFLRWMSHWTPRTPLSGGDPAIIAGEGVGGRATARGVCKHLQTTSDQQPIAQIYGGNEETLIEAAVKIEREYGDLFSWIELNTGCPSTTVMKCGGGSDMMKNRKKTLNIIQHLSESLTKLPFSIKARAWLHEEDKKEQADFLLEASQYCSKITIHGRTLKQLYSGEADRNFIGTVANRIRISLHPLSGGSSDQQKADLGGRGGCVWNGGITSYQQAQHHYAHYQVDGIMIGQAAIGNPRIFTPHQPTKEEKLETILRHLDLSIACDQLFTTPLLKGGSDAGAGGSNKLPEICIQPEHLHHHIQTNLKNPDFEAHSITEFRKFLFQYVKGLPESRERKQEMLKVKKYGEVREMIQRFFER